MTLIKVHYLSVENSNKKTAAVAAAIAILEKHGVVVNDTTTPIMAFPIAQRVEYGLVFQGDGYELTQAYSSTPEEMPIRRQTLLAIAEEIYSSTDMTVDIWDGPFAGSFRSWKLHFADLTE